jgi:cell division septum initiation protein DivIVA
MATWESGLTPPTAAGSSNRPTFGTVRRGYDPAQVLEYVSRAADQVEALQSEVRRLQAERGQRSVAPGEQAPAGQDGYEGVGARVAHLMRAFDEDVERLRRDAQEEAGRVVAEANAEAERVHLEAERLRAEAKTEVERIQVEARTEADKVRLDSQCKAEEVRVQAVEALREAQKESDKVLSSLAARRQALLVELQAIRDRMLGTTRELEATIEGASAQDRVVVVENAEAKPRT